MVVVAVAVAVAVNSAPSGKMAGSRGKKEWGGRRPADGWRGGGGGGATALESAMLAAAVEDGAELVPPSVHVWRVGQRIAIVAEGDHTRLVGVYT